MATYHVQLKNGLKGSGENYANYINREGKYARGEKKEEFVLKEEINLPPWAKNAAFFFKMADTYERANGRAYSYFEISLPNELPLERNKKIVDDFIKSEIGEDKVVAYAIHNKMASLGKVPQPHAHIMFCTRSITDKKENIKPPELFFKQYIPAYPERGGYKKDRRFEKRNSDLKKARAKVAELINEAYEEAGLPYRVSHKSLEEQRKDAIAAGDMILAEFFNRPKAIRMTVRETYATKSLLNDLGKPSQENPQIKIIGLEEVKQVKTISEKAYLAILQKMIREQKRLLMEEAYRKCKDELKLEAERAEEERRRKEEEEHLLHLPVTLEELQEVLADIGNALIAQSRANDRRINLYNTLYREETIKLIATAVVTKGKSKKYRRHLQNIQAAKVELERLKKTGADKQKIATLEKEIAKAVQQAKDMREYLNYHTKRDDVLRVAKKIIQQQRPRKKRALQLQANSEEMTKLNGKVIYNLQILKKDKAYNITRDELKLLQNLANNLDPAKRKELNLPELNFAQVQNQADILLKKLQTKIEAGNKEKNKNVKTNKKENDQCR